MWSLEVPAYRRDVEREIDVIEEVLRIYGYNQVEMPEQLRSSLSYMQKPDLEIRACSAQFFQIGLLHVRKR